MSKEKNMRPRSLSLVVLVLVIPLMANSGYADELGSTLVTYAALGGSGVTNASGGGLSATAITGDLGSSAGLASITGFPPGTVTGGTIQPGTEAAAQLQLTTALTNLALKGPGNLIGAGLLSNNSLGPGVYTVTSTALDLTPNSTLTLTGTGEFVFLMSSSLTTGSGTTLDTSGLGPGSSVYWVLQSSGLATLGDNTDWAGNILSPTAITFDPGATIDCGRALAKTLVHFDGVGTVVESGESALDPNRVGGGCTGNLVNSGGLNGGTTGGGGTSVPEPSTLLLLGSGFAGLAGKAGMRRVRARRV
jgi:hypothetical protein